jgi:bacteriocin-like protein
MQALLRCFNLAGRQKMAAEKTEVQSPAVPPATETKDELIEGALDKKAELSAEELAKVSGGIIDSKKTVSW